LSNLTDAPAPPKPEAAPEEPLPSLLDDPQVRKWGPILGLVLLAFVFLFPGIRGAYIWDDSAWLVNNTTIQAGPMGLWKVWSAPNLTPHYYPLVFTTFWVEFHQWGLGTKGPDGILRGIGYHIDNLLLHIGAVLLLYTILRRLKLPGGKAGAWLAAAIWAIHPMNVESVAWVAERKNVLSAVFFFAALLCGLIFYNVIEREAPDSSDSEGNGAPLTAPPPPADAPRWGMYAATLVLFLCALFSKTAACFLPPVLLVMIWWKRGRVTLREIALSLPLFIMALGLGAFTAHLEHSRVGAIGPEFDFSFLQRIVIAGDAVCFYIGKLFWPDPVMQIYPRFDIIARGAGGHIGQPILYLGPIVAGAIAVVLFLLRKKITRGPLAAYLFFLAGLFPVMGFINYYTMIYTFVADHYQYLAGAGMIVLAVETGLWILRRVAALRSEPQGFPVYKGAKAAGQLVEAQAERQRFMRLAGSLLFGGLILSIGVLAFGDSSLYQDPRDLWSHNAKYNTSRGAFGVWNNLADAFTTYNDRDDAMQAYKKAVTFYPDWLSYHSMGLIALAVDRVDEAKGYFDQADKLIPEFVATVRREQMQKKMQSFDAGLNVGDALPYSGAALIGQHQMDKERWDAAIKCFQEDRQILGDNPLDDFQIAQCLGGKEDYLTAIEWFKKAVALNDQFPDAWIRLGVFLRYVDREQEAEDALRKAYSLDPKNLAWLPPLIPPTLDKQKIPGLPSFIPSHEGGMIGPPVPLNMLGGAATAPASRPAAPLPTSPQTP
jgi:tetratricopeptide (TPR) repeat protein